ncbi:MAG: hypothetical protein LW875_00705 [Proteobacteria bacterium]|jgi:hypothetical protein|nr:hypothetical protein [Pseudomonadota bacterium]
MTINPLPPQAYTKETTKQAYDWLMNQPEHIRSLATSMDIAVNLYLTAKRHGTDALERPSIQNFQKELKSLAGLMEEFKPPTPPPSAAAPVMAPSQAPTPTAVTSHNRNLDAKSTEMLNEIKSGLNLSSDEEVLRLLISTGYYQLKALIKK